MKRFIQKDGIITQYKNPRLTMFYLKKTYIFFGIMMCSKSFEETAAKLNFKSLIGFIHTLPYVIAKKVYLASIMI